MRLAECDACAVCIPIPMALVRRASVSDGNMNITRPVDWIRVQTPCMQPRFR